MRLNFPQEGIHRLLAVAEIGSFDPIKSVGEIKKAGLSGATEDAECPDNGDPFAARCSYALTIIHQQQIGSQFDRERDGIFLPGIEALHCGIVDVTGLTHFNP